MSDFFSPVPLIGLPPHEIDFLNFLEEYRQCENLVDKLDKMYNFIGSKFDEDQRQGCLILRMFLKTFNNKDSHPIEIRTLLHISKPVKEHDIIKESRTYLLKTYNEMLELK